MIAKPPVTNELGGDEPGPEEGVPDILADESGSVRRTATIPASLGGSRVDQAAAEIFPDYSRSRLTEWIKEGRLTLDGEQVRPRQLVTGGEILAVDAELEAQVAMRPENIPLDLLYEDEHLLVVNKPPGLVVHPGAGNASGTLQNALLHFDANLQRVARAGIVHRLDKDTSGCLVVARTVTAHTALVAQLAERDIHRQYEALVHGAMIAGGTIDQPIDRHPRDRLKMAVRPDGREAITHYRVRERFPAHTLLQVTLETGRTHQIRVHLAHNRTPIVGDPLYGRGLQLPKGATPELSDALRKFQRQALHAEKIAFAHPVSGEPVECVAPRPGDLAKVIEALRAARASDQR